jgi:hypothetical protein
MSIDRKKADLYNQNQLAAGVLQPKHLTELVAYWQKGHGLFVDGLAGARETIPSIDWEIDGAQSELPADPAPKPTALVRGVVLGLTDDQIVRRALYLAGKASIDTLDDHIREWGAPSTCPDIYYLLKGYNGGKDPTAPDPADRWSKPGSTFVNRTCDCSGGDAWMGGVDRYQPTRMRKSVGYDGWFNTDSMIMDATLPLLAGEKRCYEADPFPTPGRSIVCKSGSYGHTIGHIGRIVNYKGDSQKFDANNSAHWDAIEVVDVSAVGAGKRANLMRTGRGWFRTGALFLYSVMTP